MLFKKIILPTAILSVAGLVACGDDSSSNSGDDSNNIPEKVETIDKAIHLNCTEEIKCTMVYVEEVKDNFFCNGTKFEPYSPILNAKDCPAEENKAEGEEKGEGEKTPESSASEAGSTDSGAESTDSNTDGGEGSEGGEEGGNGEEGSKEPTGPTGDVVSCLQVISMMGVTTQSCDEYAANSADIDSYKAECAAMNVEGFLTTTEGTGCPKNFTKKCVVSNDVASYFYEEENANESCDDLINGDDDED